MRISADQQSPHFRVDLMGKVSILLDGVDVTSRCREAYEEAGCCWLFRLDDEGFMPVVKNKALVIDQHYGKVEIVPKPGVLLLKGDVNREGLGEILELGRVITLAPDEELQRVPTPNRKEPTNENHD